MLKRCILSGHSLGQKPSFLTCSRFDISIVHPDDFKSYVNIVFLRFEIFIVSLCLMYLYICILLYNTHGPKGSLQKKKKNCVL